MTDYTGKTIFVGMDVHKKTYSVTAICDGDVVKKRYIKSRSSSTGCIFIKTIWLWKN